MLGLALLYFICIGYFAGYGRFVDQAADWDKHNAVLSDLVSRPWPVYYGNGGEHSMLTYYIAQYIVPGVIGKAFDSFRAAELSLYAWNVAGIFLVFLHLVSFLKAKRLVSQLACAAAVPFFSLPFWFSGRRCILLPGKRQASIMEAMRSTGFMFPGATPRTGYHCSILTIFIT